MTGSLRSTAGWAPLADGATTADLLRVAIAEQGSAPFLVRGRSMRGAIANGAVLELSACTVPVLVGDVVAAVLPDGRVVVHRVRRVHGDRLRLQGDGCRRPDAPIDSSAVIGIVSPPPRQSLRSRLAQLLPS